MYSIKDNTWDQIIDLPLAMYGPLSDVHNNCLYITAYYYKMEDDVFDVAKELWMFDPEKGIWQEKATALQKHLDGTFSAFGDKLFLAGGLNEDDLSLYREMAEIYDIKLDQWTNILKIHPNLDISLLCSIAYCNIYVDDGTGDIHLFGLKNTEDDEDIEILVFNPISGYLSRDQNWSRNKTLSQMALCTLPKGRFKC